MTAGIQAITNNHGTILIDDTYRNMAVIGNGTHANTASTPGTIYRAILSTTLDYTTYYWWDFGYPTAAPSGTGALEIRNALNQVCFNSLYQYARVVDVFDYDSYSNLVKTYPSGRSYAIITAKRGCVVSQEVREDPDSPPGTFYNYRRKFDYARAAVFGGTITAGWTNNPYPATWSGPLSAGSIPSPMDDTKATFIVLDVTGY